LDPVVRSFKGQISMKKTSLLRWEEGGREGGRRGEGRGREGRGREEGGGRGREEGGREGGRVGGEEVRREGGREEGIQTFTLCYPYFAGFPNRCATFLLPTTTWSADSCSLRSITVQCR
jgi:hypothetical protein